ncbi:MAG: hypothetical protein CV087_23155 [Candidatus Brocadia sp. WS118]|nr:MAG: hypothetical protein CV087_23155 [Candidatus Brocadia sp. WS118]
MAVILKGGAIFLHIPKTGGSWITEVLEEQGLIKKHIGHIHADVQRILRYNSLLTSIFHDLSVSLKGKISAKFKRNIRRRFVHNKYKLFSTEQNTPVVSDRISFMFCFVRHPISWYESFWRYMCNQNWPRLGDSTSIRNWHPCAILNGLGDLNFNSFIEKILKRRPGFVTEMYGWYTPPGVKWIGHQENLVDDLIKILNEININFDESRIRNHPKVNVSTEINAYKKINWDRCLLDEVLKMEYAGLQRYDYRG